MSNIYSIFKEHIAYPAPRNAQLDSASPHLATSCRTMRTDQNLSARKKLPEANSGLYAHSMLPRQIRICRNLVMNYVLKSSFKICPGYNIRRFIIRATVVIINDVTNFIIIDSNQAIYIVFS